MNLSNMKISVRLGFGFASVLGLLALLTGVGLWCLQTAGGITSHMVEHTLVKERLVTEWRHSTHVNGVRTIAVADNPDPAEQQRLEPQIKATSRRISEIQKKLDAMSKDAEETRLYADVAQKRTSYLNARNTVFNQKKAGNEEEAKKLAETLLEPALATYVDSIQKLTEHAGAAIAQASDNVVNNYRTGQIILLALGLLALLVGAGFAWRIGRSITRPLARAVQIAQTVAAGDLTSRIEVRGHDEAGQLLQALKEMNESLVRIVSEVRNGTDTIAGASGQIADGNLDLSSRTEQQASSLEETASSMEELMSTVKQNADNAYQADQLATAASAVAGKGGEVVSQVVETMESINTSAKKIADIIGVIDGIAFQTNILALNAAVEAARAGEQGRGFAVVASEVRNLAQRSAAAAKEIKELIGDSVEKVDSGARLVDQAGATMNEIVDSIRRVTAIVAEISTASQEQTSGIEQINAAITQMDQVTQQNASLVEEAAAASSALQDQAGKLAQTVSVFKLGSAQARLHVVQATAKSLPLAGAALPALSADANAGR